MSRNEHSERTRSSLGLAALVATASAVLALALAGGHAAQGHSSDHAAGASGVSEQRAALHDKMRRLWEDHITWTRLFIVSASADLPDLQATTEFLAAYYGGGVHERVELVGTAQLL